MRCVDIGYLDLAKAQVEQGRSSADHRGLRYRPYPAYEKNVCRPDWSYRVKSAPRDSQPLDES